MLHHCTDSPPAPAGAHSGPRDRAGPELNWGMGEGGPPSKTKTTAIQASSHSPGRAACGVGVKPLAPLGDKEKKTRGNELQP